ncbi:MAG: YigZ family protein [Firmicutes bacterium]|nr:YigZ family protein [Bacillota bacterium]
MNLLCTATLEVKKSKFIGYLYDIESKDEIKKIINILKKEHKKANHFVYAFKVNNTAGKSDDKEPSGTAGIQLYNILEMNNAQNKLLVVVRFFGGTKLGAGLLARTYKNSALQTLKLYNEINQNYL